MVGDSTTESEQPDPLSPSELPEKATSTRKPSQPRGKKPPNPISPEEVQGKVVFWFALIGLVQKTVYCLLAGFVVFALVYWGVYKPVEASAGQATTIKVFQEWLGGINAPVWLGWLLAAGTTAALLYIRREHKKERDDWHRRNAEMEKRLDMSRTSSNIDQHGEQIKGNPK